MTLIGQGGFPDSNKSIELLRKTSQFRLSMRLPPTLNPDDAIKAVQNHFDYKVVDGFTLKVSNFSKGEGFNANVVDEKSL